MRATHAKSIFTGMLFVLSCYAVAHSSTTSSVNNEILLNGSSPFEDLTEFAISGDREGIKRALQAYGKQATNVENQLRPTYRRTFKSLVTDIQQAAQQADYDVIALKSPEAYRMLVEALDTSSLKIPAEVSLLDYVGFRYLAVLHAKPIDWPALEHAATKARENWSAIRSKITDKSLRDAVDVTMDGLMKASTEKNTAMALFAAQVDLAQVDLLEAFFDNTGK